MAVQFTFLVNVYVAILVLDSSTAPPRAEIGSADGQVAVELVLDAEERTVEVPPALAAALAADPAAKAIFDGLAYTHRKEFARWIAEAKKEETRERRVAKRSRCSTRKPPAVEPRACDGKPADPYAVSA